MDSDNGILALVPGEIIAAGIQQLPTAGPDQEGEPERRVIVSDVADLGLVEITYRLRSYRFRRSTRWHWLAVHAAADRSA